MTFLLISHRQLLSNHQILAREEITIPANFILRSYGYLPEENKTEYILSIKNSPQIRNLSIQFHRSSTIQPVDK